MFKTWGSKLRSDFSQFVFAIFNGTPRVLGFDSLFRIYPDIHPGFLWYCSTSIIVKPIVQCFLWLNFNDVLFIVGDKLFQCSMLKKHLL